MLAAQVRAGRGQRVRWAIQLPLCDTCYTMHQVLTAYRPSRHGPPERAQWNRWVVLALLVLALGAVVGQLLSASLFGGLDLATRYAVWGTYGLVMAGLFGWNVLASQRARDKVYGELVHQAGHRFGDVTLVPGQQEVVLTFDNEAYGQAFEQANRDLLGTR